MVARLLGRLAGEEMKTTSLEFVSAGQGSELAEQCGARQYLECSALTGEGVDDVFEAATRAAIRTWSIIDVVERDTVSFCEVTY